MANNKPTVIEITTREILKKFPELSNLGAARKLCKDFPEIFKSVEQARCSVRRVRGSKSNRERRSISDKSLFTKANLEKLLSEIPSTEVISYETYHLPDECKIIGVINDLHIPFIDNEACKAAFRYMKQKKVDTLFINGDAIDNAREGKFITDVNARDTATELDMLWDFLAWAKKVLGKNVKIYYKLGNHEDRTERYMLAHAAEIVNKVIWKLKDLHDYRNLGLVTDFIDNKRIVKVGKLSILHGHEIGLSGSDYANPARTLWLKTNDTCLMGHIHRTSEHTEPNLSRKVKTCWTIGCLCQLPMAYRPINRWNHGFAIVVNHPENFSVENKRIYNGLVL